MPLAPEERVDVPVGEAVDGRRELALEREAAHLPIGHDIESRILLAAQRRVDGCVLDALEAGGRQLSPLQGLLCGEELRRAEETADDIAPRYHVPSLLRV